MRIAIIAFVALLSGCASSTPVYTPDGRQGVLLTCSGWARNWGMCLERAGEICGARGYDLIDKQGETVDIGGLFHQPMTNRQMMVVCK